MRVVEVSTDVTWIIDASRRANLVGSRSRCSQWRKKGDENVYPMPSKRHCCTSKYDQYTALPKRDPEAGLEFVWTMVVTAPELDLRCIL